MLSIITADDLRRALEDAIPDNASLDDLRDARRAATVLPADECQRALLDALRTRSAAIAREFD
jgi:hypothetical protein